MTAQIFLSHSGKDRAICQALIAELTKRDIGNIFVDYDRVGGIAPGQEWERRIYSELRRCDVVLALDGEAWRQSPWCFAEIALAKAFGKQVILLTTAQSARSLEGAAALLHDKQWMLAPVTDREAMDALSERLKRLGVGVARQIRWDHRRAPYAGLSALDELDAGVFFGREEQVRDASSLIELCTSFHNHRVVLLNGRSGCGKSSLLRAGIVPRFRLLPDWTVIGPTLATERAICIADVAKAAAKSKVLVAVDQLDEMLEVSASNIDVWTSNVHALQQACGDRVVVVATLRSDVLDLLLERMGSAGLGAETMAVTALSLIDCRKIIERPALLAGVAMDEALVDALVADAAVAGKQSEQANAVASDILPMLAVTLRRLWDQRDDHGRISLAVYQRFGGLDGMIEQTAEQLMRPYLNRETEACIEDAFLSMVRIDSSTGHITRKVSDLTAIDQHVRVVIDRFVSEGLIVLTGVPGQIMLAHEALARVWPRFAQWIAAARVDQPQLDSLEKALERFRSNTNALLAGEALLDVEQLAMKKHRALAHPEAAQLLAMSLAKRDEAITQEEQRKHALRMSKALRLASDARDALERDPNAAFRIAWEAALCDRNEITESVFRECLDRFPAASLALFDEKGFGVWADFSPTMEFLWIASTRDRAITLWAPERELVSIDVQTTVQPTPHKSKGWTCAAVTDAALMVVASEGMLSLVDDLGTTLARCELEGWLKERADEHCGIVLSDERFGVFYQHQRVWLFELSSKWNGLQVTHSMEIVPDGTERQHDMHRSIDEVETWVGDKGLIGIAVDFSKHELAARIANKVFTWSFDGAYTDRVDSASLVFDCQYLADGTLVVGEMQGRGCLYLSHGRKVVFRDVKSMDLKVLAVHPDKRHFITADNYEDHALEVWTDRGELVSCLAKDPENHYRCAAFSPNGEHVAVSLRFRLIRIWEWRTGRVVEELYAHEDVSALRFDSSGAFLLTCGSGIVRLWLLDKPPLPSLKGHRAPVDRLITHRGRVLSSSSADDTTCVWGPDEERLILSGGRFLLACGDSDMLLTQDKERRLRAWRLSSVGALSASCQCEILDVVSIEQRTPQVALNDDTIALRRGTYKNVNLPGARGVVVTVPVLHSQSNAELRADDGTMIAELQAVHSPSVNWIYNGEDQRAELGWIAINPRTSAAVAASRSGMVWMWNAAGEELASFVVERRAADTLLSFVVDPLGEFVLAGIRSSIEMWDWSGRLVMRLCPLGYKVETIVFSPDGSHFLTVADDGGRGPAPYFVQWWDRNGTSIASFDVSGRPDGWAFDPRGRYLALQCSSVTIYDACSGELIGSLYGAFGSSARSMAVSPDGELVAAVFSDGIARVWALAQRQRTLRLKVCSDAALAFSADGRRLLVPSDSGAIEQYALDISDLYEAAAERVDGGFKDYERSRYNIQQPILLDEYLQSSID